MTREITSTLMLLCGNLPHTQNVRSIPKSIS